MYNLKYAILLVMVTVTAAYLATVAGLGSGIFLSRDNTFFVLKVGIVGGVLGAFAVPWLLRQNRILQKRYVWFMFGALELLLFVVLYYLVAINASC